MLQKLISFKITRVFGLLPVSFDPNKITFSPFWYLISWIFAMISILSTSFRFYYMNVGSEYQLELDKFGYIFDVILQIEPIIIVALFCLIYYPIIRIHELKDNINFVNALDKVIEAECEQKLMKIDRILTSAVVSFLVFIIGGLQFFYSKYHGLYNRSEYCDLLINFNETILTSMHLLNLLTFFSIIYTMVCHLEEKFNDGFSVESIMITYDRLLTIIAKFRKVHEFNVRVMILYTYFDTVASFKGLFDWCSMFSDGKIRKLETNEDLVIAFWYLSFLPHVILMIYFGNAIERKVRLS